MKKIIILIMITFIIISVTIPIGALGSPVTDGAYNLPPSWFNSSYSAEYSVMRSYANVSTVYVHSSTQTNSVTVNGANANWYPAFMVSTPDVMVAPSADGFGRVQNYSSTYQFSNRYALKSVIGGTNTFSSIPIAQEPNLYSRHPSGNAITYTYVFDDVIDIGAIQYGIVAGEWGDHSSTNNIITGYSIQKVGYGPWTLDVQGCLTYSTDGNNVITVDIDQTYTLADGEIFAFNPQTLLHEIEVVNFYYYTFIGNWTADFESNNGTLREYKAYDFANLETFNYNASVNQYTQQNYSINLYPISRISSKLTPSSSGATPEGTLTVNYAGVFDVSDYEFIDVDIPPIEIFYSGDIEDGYFNEVYYENGVDVVVDMSVQNTFERNTSLFINENGESNVGHYEFAYVNIPQTVIDDVNAFDWLFGAIEGILNLEIAPSFSIGNILLFIAGFAVIVWILKIYLGG